MPTRAPTACTTPRCPNVAPCPDHQRQLYRGSSTQQGYGADHRRWRAAILARDPICRACHRAPATQADHIIPIRRGGDRYTLDNGQGLCASCHSRATAQYDGGWGRPLRDGKAAMQHERGGR